MRVKEEKDEMRLHMPSRTLRSLTLASVLMHSDNTVYAVRFAYPNAFDTSKTRETLYAMVRKVLI